jgi:peptidoglycan/xylan/chitin deacetylase (PgdA/CDA1 family)
MDRRRFLTTGAAAGAALVAACRPRSRSGGGGGVGTGGGRASTTSGSRSGSASTPSPTAPGDAAASGPARFVQHGPASARAVALTFHGSGDPALTRRMLAEARRLGIPLTVFAVGNWLDANPGMARELVADGHELANHTYTHPVIGRLGGPAVLTEITRCRDALAAHGGGAPARWFRPSGMDVATPLVLEEAGKAGYRTVVGYSVDSRDFTDPGPAAIEARVASGLAPGAIVSLHLGHPGTITAMEPMVRHLTSVGLRAVTVSDLLGTTS